MYNDTHAVVVQLVRTLPCHGRGRGFESHRPRIRKAPIYYVGVFHLNSKWYYKTMNKYIIYTLALLGTLFSGFLSAVKFFTDTCALGESCPLFFGKPACYFGFGMFLILFILSNILVFKKENQSKITGSMIFVAVLGILFAGKFVVTEIVEWSTTGFQWSALLLPTCAYGLIFYVLVLIFVLKYKKTNI